MKSLVYIFRQVFMTAVAAAVAFSMYVYTDIVRLPSGDPPPTTPPENYTISLDAGETSSGRIVGLANLRRMSESLNPLTVAPGLERIAQRYTETFARNGQAVIYDYTTIQSDLSTEAYYLGGYIYQLSGHAEEQSEEGLVNHVLSVYLSQVLDAGVTDAGFAYMAVPEGGYYYSFLLADPLSVSAPRANLDNPGPATQTGQQAAILELLNAARVEQGMGPLQINTQLHNAAYNHSLDQASRERMTHAGSDNSVSFDRAQRAGYLPIAIAENVLVRNNRHAPGAFDQWWNSPGHYNNMMNPQFTEIGIAYAVSPRGDHYYTMVLGTAGG
jgi:uncharacterized protein YkwD